MTAEPRSVAAPGATSASGAHVPPGPAAAPAPRDSWAVSHATQKDPGAHGVTIVRVRALRGPNRHATLPVLQATVDIGSYEHRASTDFPGFAERLVAWLPTLDAHECSLGERGGFIRRLERGTYLAHIVEHVALELQCLMGYRVGFGRVRGTGARGVYDVVVAYGEEEPGREAFREALRLTLAAMHDEPYDARAEVHRLRALAAVYRLGPSTRAIVQAARERDIPVRRLAPTGNLVQLGWGLHQRRIRGSQTSTTSAIARDLCRSGPLRNGLLHAAGVPVPRGSQVRSADDAWAAARDVGAGQSAPVVVRPDVANADVANGGNAVAANLRTEADVRAGFALAQDSAGATVLVEEQIEGDAYRLLVANGTMVAAARRDPAQVVGDGRRTVAELVASVNRDRRRAGQTEAPTRIRLDAIADLVLQQQGLTRNAVPAPDRAVRLRPRGYPSSGALATDVTDGVHPANARLAELVALILGMDVLGVDVVCRDIGRPLPEQRGAVVGASDAPALQTHLFPARGRRRDVGRSIVEMLFPPGTTGRIPLVAVTGTNGKTTTTRLIAHLYRTARYVVGMTCTDGIYVAGERILSGDCSGPQSARAVLLHPRVEAAVLETARGGILREGLAFDLCSVAMVTNVTPDHLGMDGVDTLEDLAQVKRLVVEQVSRDGAAVLNADDPMSAAMAAKSDARVIYFSTDAQNPLVAAHTAAGGACVLAEDGWIVLLAGAERTPLVALDSVPFTIGGRIPFQVQNALAATAAGWAAGLDPGTIAQGLATFATDTDTVPGRFNVTGLAGREVIFDYGHNVAGMRALAAAVQAMGRRRTVLALALPGDRRDDDLIETVRAIVPVVDELVLYDERDRRGRARGEVPDLLRRHLSGGPSVQIVSDQAGAIREAWARARPGDRLIVIADKVDEGIALVNALSASAPAAPAATTAPA